MSRPVGLSSNVPLRLLKVHLVTRNCLKDGVASPLKMGFSKDISLRMDDRRCHELLYVMFVHDVN